MTLAQPKDTPISDELRAALQWWLVEAESAEPHEGITINGLCPVFLSPKEDVSDELKAVLHRQFPGLLYPFGRDDYFARDLNYTMHLCPKRRAWVRAMIADAPRKDKAMSKNESMTNQMACAIANLESMCAAKDAEIERLKDAIRFVGKWVERGLFDKDVSAKDALETIAYLPGMPWNSGRWDVDHKSYAEAYYKSFPKTRAALKDQNNE